MFKDEKIYMKHLGSYLNRKNFQGNKFKEVFN